MLLLVFLLLLFAIELTTVPPFEREDCVLKGFGWKLERILAAAPPV